MIIDRLWKSQPGDYFCISTKSKSQKWEDHFFKRSELGKVGEFIEDNRDKDIWFCPHGFRKPRRIKPYAVLGTLLWADLDEADPREMSIKPTVAFESSPGRFVGLWVVDKEVDEDINRRLTYAMEADVSGWDLTQVLRVPGTTNYKYQSLPKVRTLWSDGPEYRLKEILKELPEDEGDAADSGAESDASEVFKQYEKKLPQWCRRELLNGKPTPGKRSEMIWKLGQTLIEVGMTREEAFVLLKASPWNKFKGRRNEEAQLRREIEKSINKRLKAKSEPKEEGYKFLSESMADVEEENLDWIWFPYLARGELSILEGDPGLGKSYLAQMVSGYIVDGKKLPSVRPRPALKGSVAYFDIENSAGTVTKKRLVENGVKNLEDYYQDEQPFSIDDNERLEEVFDAIERRRPMLVVFDTLNTYIGKADTHKSSESQQAMAVFREIAKRFRCAVLVLRHLTKGSKERAIYRGQGSIAFAGLARVVMTVGTLPTDPEVRAVAVTKVNVTKPPKALCFTIKELPDTIKSQDRSKFEFGDWVDLTADEMLSATPEKDDTTTDFAKEFLKDTLDDGAIDFRVLQRKAESRNIAQTILYRAADELKVVRKGEGFGKDKKSMWSLPKATRH